MSYISHHIYSNVDTPTQTKKVELEAAIQQNSPDIICITKLFPKNNLNLDNSVYNIEGYTLNVDNNAIRGTGIYIEKNITIYTVSLMN